MDEITCPHCGFTGEEEDFEVGFVGDQANFYCPDCDEPFYSGDA